MAPAFHSMTKTSVVRELVVAPVTCLKRRPAVGLKGSASFPPASAPGPIVIVIRLMDARSILILTSTTADHVVKFAKIRRTVRRRAAAPIVTCGVVSLPSWIAILIFGMAVKSTRRKRRRIALSVRPTARISDKRTPGPGVAPSGLLAILDTSIAGHRLGPPDPLYNSEIRA